MDTVQSLTGIWTELLGQPDIGPDDDFFALGGHSLLGASLLARLQKTYGVSLPLRALFEAPTIRQLAQRVDTMLWVSAGAVSTANQDREELEL